MKSFSFYKSAEVLPFGIETIEQWIEDNLHATNEIRCSNHQHKIIWFTTGSPVGYDRTDAQAKKGYIVCLNAVSRNKVFVDADSKGYIVSFTDDFLNIGELEFDLTCQSKLMHLFSKSAGIIVNDDLTNELKDLVTRMIIEFRNAFLFKTEILKRYLKIFLIYLTRQFEEMIQPVVKTRNTVLVQSFMSELDKSYRDKKMVAYYAEILFVTPNYLNEIVKKVTGYVASYHIRQRVVFEAKRMALYSDYTMKEIAYDLGFLDSAHFSKFFKSTTGSNFTDLKKDKLTISVAV